MNGQPGEPGEGQEQEGPPPPTAPHFNGPPPPTTAQEAVQPDNGPTTSSSSTLQGPNAPTAAAATAAANGPPSIPPQQIPYLLHLLQTMQQQTAQPVPSSETSVPAASQPAPTYVPQINLSSVLQLLLQSGQIPVPTQGLPQQVYGTAYTGLPPQGNGLPTNGPQPYANGTTEVPLGSTTGNAQQTTEDDTPAGQEGTPKDDWWKESNSRWNASDWEQSSSWQDSRDRPYFGHVTFPSFDGQASKFDDYRYDIEQLGQQCTPFRSEVHRP